MGDMDWTIVKVVLGIALVAAFGWALLIAITWAWWALPWVAAAVLGVPLAVSVAKESGSVILGLLFFSAMLAVAAKLSKTWFPWAVDHGPDELWNVVARSLGIRGPSGSKRWCPKCRNTKLTETVHSSSSYDTTMTETRRITHYDSDGNETGYSEQEYEVPAVSSYTSYRMTCAACGHSWIIP